MKLAQKLAVNYFRARLNLLAVFSKRKAAEKAFDVFSTPYYKSKKPAPAIFKKGVPLSISLKGNTVNGFVWNKGGIKRVLILHGFESTIKNFDAYIEAFIKKDYEVLAFDAPAHGISGGKKISLPLYIEMIEVISLYAGALQGIVAHSFGALAAVHFIEALPNQYNTKLVLIAPATETTSAIDRFFTFLRLSKGVRYEFETFIETKTGKPASYFSVARALQHIHAPVLWVHDKDDDITPFKDAAPVMQKEYTNVSFFITEGLGHKNIYRDNTVIETVVDFI